MLAVLAAHPDDETLGASSLLALPGATVVHLTDGVPAEPRFRAPSFRDEPLAYGLARRGELHGALSLAGVPAERVHALGAADQAAVEALAPLARRLARLLAELRPRRLVTHAYEGGHPDHDAAAFVARAALELLGRRRLPAPALFEMALYHAAGGPLRTLEFLPAPGARTLTRRLGAAGARRKREMLARFESQREVLGWFPSLAVERFRRAPPADFSRPPHGGRLWYERMGFPVSGRDFRARAAGALAELSRA